MDKLQGLREGNSLAIMRLLLEGAISIYEDEAASLFSMALKQEEVEAALAFSLLGSALYELKTIVTHLMSE